MPRAVDFHVHLPTPDWLDGSMAGSRAVLHDNAARILGLAGLRALPVGYVLRGGEPLPVPVSYQQGWGS